MNKIEQQRILPRKSIPAFALVGALGFGIGGVIGGAITVPFVEDWVVLGAVGGASMGLALRGWRGAVILALAGSVGFGIGYPLFLFLGSFILRPIGEILSEPLGDIWTLGVFFLLAGIIGMIEV